MMLFIISIVYAIIGFFLIKFPPKKINMFYGWRTPSATKNIDNWNFANHYGGKLFLWTAVILVLLGVFEFILGCNKIITFSKSKVIDEIVVFSSIILIIIIGEVKIRHIKI
ncbi:MAG: SdpI family protein [Bacillota bacterium]|nr:SdpI family protein [Bacillota bacterium]